MNRKHITNLSFIIPAMNENKTIEVLYDRISEEVEQLNLPHEIILIDDGSTDDTWKVMSELASYEAYVSQDEEQSAHEIMLKG